MILIDAMNRRQCDCYETDLWLFSLTGLDLLLVSSGVHGMTSSVFQPDTMVYPEAWMDDRFRALKSKNQAR